MPRLYAEGCPPRNSFHEPPFSKNRTSAVQQAQQQQWRAKGPPSVSRRTAAKPRLPLAAIAQSTRSTCLFFFKKRTQIGRGRRWLKDVSEISYGKARAVAPQSAPHPAMRMRAQRFRTYIILCNLHIGIADGMPSAMCMDLPLFLMIVSTRAFQRCRGTCPTEVCTYVYTNVHTHVHTPRSAPYPAPCE